MPGWGMTTRLATVVGPARAKQMILTGLPIDAERAALWGLVSEVVPAADLDAATDELAARIADPGARRRAGREAADRCATDRGVRSRHWAAG